MDTHEKHIVLTVAIVGAVAVLFLFQSAGTNLLSDSNGISGSAISRGSKKQCNDGRDNDLDGHVDTFYSIGDSKCANSKDNDESPRDFCNDNEGAISYYAAGTVSGEDNSVPFSVPDTCITATVLREYYCGNRVDDYDYIFIDYQCPGGNSSNNSTGGCMNGACV